MWYLASDHTASYTLRYRFNGGRWRDRPLTAAEVALLDGPPGIQGAMGHMIDVPLADLVQGDNTLELVTANIKTPYPSAAS
jgi:hypothetical protein